MTHELLVSTRRGLLIGQSEDRRSWEWGPVQFAGWQIDYAVRDTRQGEIWVAASHAQWGPHLHRSEDGGETWDEVSAPEFQGESYDLSEFDPETLAFKAPQRVAASLGRVWTLEPGAAEDAGTIYAGVDPAALFVSRDNGGSWDLCRALWDHSTREAWMPGAAGLALHHIQIDPGDPAHLYVAISAAGVFESRDGGVSWSARNSGCRADHLPDPMPEAGQCVHSFHLHPAQPARLYQQHHPGMYRSDDGGAHWSSIREGLPGEFGFASTIDPNDPEAFFVIPLEFDQARIPVDGKLCVFRTRDAGSSWQALAEGLPQEQVLQSVYRQAFCHDGATDSAALGLYFGTSGGHVYASDDGGEHWRELLAHAAVVTSVRCS